MDINMLGIGSVAAITVICYLIANTVKQTTLDNKWLPSICGAAGAVLGVVGMFVVPDYPATDVITAIAVGIVSGLAATGVDQLYKQLSPTSTEATEE